MRRYSIFIVLVLFSVVQYSIFAGGNRETPTRNNVYFNTGSLYSTEYNEGSVNFGVGYEGAIGNYFSLGVQLGSIIAGEDLVYTELLIRPRVYFGSALEKFFIGGNFGGYFGTDYSDYITCLETGYKFVFGSNSSGFSLEPSIGYEFITGLININFSFGYAFGGGNEKPKPTPQPVYVPPAPTVKDGIYIGIIVFGPDAEDITGGVPVYLDQQGQGMAMLNRLLETKYQRTTSIGTALFYSAHLALANMKKAETRIPRNDLANVTLLTFTDGLDVSSTGLSLNPINDPGNINRLDFAGGQIKPYMDFVKGEINNRKINGTSITARVVAVQGDDISDITAFSTALRSLATNNSFVRDNINMASLNREFQTIANEIVNSWTQSTFTMVTPEYAPGTKVRMVFGNETGQNAYYYIDGEVTVRNREYYLTNISYGGGIYSSVPLGGEIKGKTGNRSVSYEFSHFTGYNLNNAYVTQWLITAGNNVWQKNSEYDSAGASQRKVEKHNALIYLVLDRSSSIAPNDVPRVQQAAKDFIKILYDTYWRN